LQLIFDETARPTWGARASDAMLKRAYLDFGENFEAGRNDAKQADDNQC